MDAIDPLLADPVKLVNRLDADLIRDRLQALSREREALLVLLRSAQCAQRNREKGRKEGGRK
jgi:hypothetical protein